MDKALVFGTKDCRVESCQGHFPAFRINSNVFLLHAGKEKWTHWDLNPGPSACEADVIPLRHVPLNNAAASESSLWPCATWPTGAKKWTALALNRAWQLRHVPRAVAAAPSRFAALT